MRYRLASQNLVSESMGNRLDSMIEVGDKLHSYHRMMHAKAM